MYAHQNRFIGSPGTFDQSHVLQTVALLAESDVAEMSVLGRHIHFRSLFYHRFLFQAIGNQVADGDDFDAELVGHLLQLRHAGHSSVFVQNLNQGCGRLQSRQACQIDSCLCVSGTAQNTLILGIKRVDVARTSEIGRFAVRVGQCLDGFGTVVSGNAGGASLQFVHSNGERSAENRSVVTYLMRQFQFLAARYGDRSTQNTPSVGQHKVNLFGSDHFGSGDEVALIFTILVVYYDQELTLFEVGQSLFNCV